MENIQTAEYVHSAHSARDLLHDGRPEVAFVGRSNVGKSSLLNALLRRKGLARTSSTPGRTQTVNYFLVNGRLWFVDLPGYGYAKTSKDKRKAWARTVEQYFESAPTARRPRCCWSTPRSRHAARRGGLGIPHRPTAAEPLVVATKIDKVPRGKRSSGMALLRERVGLPERHPLIEVSASTGEGVKELMARDHGQRAGTPGEE